MLEDRNAKLDLLALGLLAAVLFCGLALVSYQRADPLGLESAEALVYPARVDVGNICGRAGAWVADLLLRALGVGAWYLVLSLAVLDALLLMRRPIPQPALRCFGWLVSLVGLTTLVALALPQIWPTFWGGPEIGPGGYVGAAGRGLLEMNFAAAGAYILTVSLIFGGLLLSTDYHLVRLTAWCLGTPMKKGFGAGRAVFARRRRGTDKPASDDLASVEDAATNEDDSSVSVRILGRRTDANQAQAAPASATNDSEAEEGVDQPEAEEADESEEGDEETDADEAKEEDEAASGAAPEKRGVGRRIADALRLRSGPRRDPHDKVIEELEAAAETEELPDYQLPDINLLLPSEQFQYNEQEKEVRRKAKILEKTFANFGFNVKVVEIETGPVIAQFEVELEAGLRLSKITGLSDDLAIALRVPSVRIVAPIPGKNTVGIEVPNTQRQLVRLREVMEEDSAKVRKMKIPIFMGKDVSGNPLTVDLSTLPHLLIAGRTGTGKSVCLNSIIMSMIMTRRPDEVRMLMIDPKMVELSPYKNLPHLMHPVVTDMRKAEAILGWAVEKMEERYALLARAGVRHVSVYNQLGEEELMQRVQPETDEERKSIPLHLPYIVCIADEIADLMMTAPKEVEGHIIRLAQKSRAVGIHLVLATQKPTVDVITGLIKSNLPARICFQVASRTDSRVVLDEMGADKLLGNGDLLFLWPNTSTLLRGQGTYLSDDEITRVIGAVATTEPQFVRELVQLQPEGATADGNRFKNRDDVYEAAIDVVVREGRGSVSLLQRALGIGYGRAARLIDFMAEDGIVGTYNGSQAREVVVSPEQWAAMQQEANAEAVPVPATPPRRNRIEVTPRSRNSVDEEELGEDELDEDGLNSNERALAAGDKEADQRNAEELDEEEDDAVYGVRPPAELASNSRLAKEPSGDDDLEVDEDDEEDEDEETADGDELADEDEEEEVAEDEDEAAEEEDSADEEDSAELKEKPHAPPPGAGRIRKPRGNSRQARSA